MKRTLSQLPIPGYLDNSSDEKAWMREIFDFIKRDENYQKSSAMFFAKYFVLDS